MTKNDQKKKDVPARKQKDTPPKKVVTRKIKRNDSDNDTIQAKKPKSASI